MNRRFSVSLSVILLILPMLPTSAWAIDWQSVPGRKITLFYPGQVSWEWLLTDHKGAKDIRAGQFCLECHQGLQKEMGQKLVTGELLESSPPQGKAGSIELEIKTAHDADKLYFHLQWPGGVVPVEKAYPEFEAMASILFDDGQVPEISRAGCWGVCHDDVNGMPSSSDEKNINKYLVKSRSKMTRRGGGDHIKPAAQLNALFAKGFFAELWQAKLNRGQQPLINEGYILETRHDHQPPKVTVKGGFDNGRWSIEFSRALVVNEPGYKQIIPGKTYAVGFAIHDGYVRGRRHYVSFRQTLRLNQGPADLIADKQ